MSGTRTLRLALIALQSHLSGMRSKASGHISVTAALMILPLILSAGAALDYGMVIRARTELQSALDSATLAAAAKDGALTPSVAQSFFRQNASLEKVTVSALDFSKQADGTVSGTVRAVVPAIFMRMVRRGDYTLRLTSSASAIFADTRKYATYSLVSAKGSYDKELYVYAKDSAGRIVKRVLAMSYDYTYNPATRRWNSRSVVYAAANSFVPGKNQTQGLMLVVYADRTGRGDKINPVELDMQAPDSASFYRSTGSCQKAPWRRISWEETRNPAGDFADMVISASCTSRQVGTTTVRLVK